jgi:predicted small lipoprotein YifL
MSRHSVAKPPHRSAVMALTALCVLPCAAALAGCGQKGPLVLPSPPSAAAAPAAPASAAGPAR